MTDQASPKRWTFEADSEGVAVLCDGKQIALAFEIDAHAADPMWSHDHYAFAAKACDALNQTDLESRYPIITIVPSDSAALEAVVDAARESLRILTKYAAERFGLAPDDIHVVDRARREGVSDINAETEAYLALHDSLQDLDAARNKPDPHTVGESKA